MTVRATARGAARTSLDGATADVLVCGASFAGLAVARELALTARRAGDPAPDVLVLDRYEIGERATSACAAPTPWLHAMGVQDAICQELAQMTFTTPRGRVRYRLPWSWSSFDYRCLCRLLWAQCGTARFETAVVRGRSGDVVHTDRGDVRAPLVVDACGWRRVLSQPHCQPPEAPLSRGLEVHPAVDASAGACAATDLDIWVERDLVRRGYGWRVPAGDEQRVGTCSYDPRRHVKDPTRRLAARLEAPTVRYQGNWFPHRLRAATEGGAFFVGDSAGHCFPLSGEGIRTAFYFGIACGRELAEAAAGRQTRAQALERYAAFHRRHAPAFRRALALQRAIPALPPAALSLLLRVIRLQKLVDRAFGWYLDQAHPALALEPGASAATRPEGSPHGRRPAAQLIFRR